MNPSPVEKNPLISVVIPAYNAANFLPRTIASILNQSYRDIEVIIVDDGSEDATLILSQKFAQQDPRIRLFQQENSGVASARNLGIQAAQGEYIAPIDADDIWHPEAMKKMIAIFQQTDETVGVVYAWSLDINEEDEPSGGFHSATVQGNVYKTLICHNFLGNASSTLIRKSCLEQVGGYDTQLRTRQAQGCEDWDVYLRLAEQYEYRNVPEFLVGYRNIIGSMSGDFKQMARSQHLMLQAVQDKHPELPTFLYRVSKSSYYLYLAHQSFAGGLPSQTLYWLRQAIRVDPVTPLGRLGFYSLLLKSMIHLGKQQFWPSRFHEQTRDGPSIRSSVVQPCPNVFVDIPISRFRLQLKLLVSHLLHRSLSNI